MPKSYLTKMREFRAGNTQTATPASASNQPLPVVKNSVLPSRKRGRTLHQSRARSRKRKTQFLSERSSMAGKRKRDKKGHFIKAKSRVKRKRPAASRKRTSTTKRRKTTTTRKRARRAAPRKIKRIKRALGRKPNGKFVRRRKHRVAGHLRKVAGARKRKRVKAHLSYETATPNPRRRRRAKRRAAREVEEVMPKKRRRRAKKASSAPRRRRRRNAAYENPVKRRKRRRVARENPRRKRRRSTARRVRTSRLCKRPSRKRPRYVTVGRVSRRRRPARRKALTRRKKHPTAGYMLPAGHNEYGEEGYALENPLSGNELLLAGFTATIGFALTDYLDRWLAVKELATTGSTSLASGQSPLLVAQAVLSKPGIWRILAQAGAAAAPFAAAYYVQQPMGRAALQGVGLGALIHLGSQLVTHFVITKVASGATPPAAGAAPGFMNNLGAYYMNEMSADNASDLATTGTKGTLTVNGVVAGLPRGLGAPRGAPRAYSVPRALGAPAVNRGANGQVGDCGGGCNPPGPPTGDCTPSCDDGGECISPCDPSMPPAPAPAPVPPSGLNGFGGLSGAPIRMPTLSAMFPSD